MKEKAKRRTKFWVIGAVIIVIIAVAVAVILNMPKKQEVSDSGFDLSTLADGTYRGECENGLVAVVVDVEVENHEIKKVDIMKHQNGLGKAAEAIVEDIVEQQGVEADAISGATMSSQTILKAVENALSEQ